MPISPLLEKTSIIRYELGTVDYSATGILFEQGDDPYLITNKHVVEHEHEISPDELRISLRREDNPSQTKPERISMFDRSGNELWISHPEYPEADIVAIPLSIDLDQTGNTPFIASNLQERDTHLALAGGSAIVIGYPGIIGAGETTKPIVKNALISSDYGEDFGEEPCFLMDANVQEGMSGSPVLLKPNMSYPDSDGNLFRIGASEPSYPTRLLGIHSGPLEREDKMNLHKVWYAELIKEIINED